MENKKQNKSYESDSFLILKRAFKPAIFQLSCPECYESINVHQEQVKVDREGKPERSELERVFSRTDLNAEECPCCGNENLTKHYGYEPNEYLVTDDDLPF